MSAVDRISTFYNSLVYEIEEALIKANQGPLADKFLKLLCEKNVFHGSGGISQSGPHMDDWENSQIDEVIGCAHCNRELHITTQIKKD